MHNALCTTLKCIILFSFLAILQSYEENSELAPESDLLEIQYATCS